MSQLKHMIGWVVRGGQQTRDEMGRQTAAIQELQQQVADLRSTVEGHGADGERVSAEVRSAVDDLSGRLGAIVDRLDALDDRVADQDAAVASLARVVAPPDDA